MSEKLSRSRTLKSAGLQIFGGVLVLVGTLAGMADSLAWWQGLIGLVFAVYFLATGGYRLAIGRRLPPDAPRR